MPLMPHMYGTCTLSSPHIYCTSTPPSTVLRVSREPSAISAPNNPCQLVSIKYFQSILDLNAVAAHARRALGRPGERENSNVLRVANIKWIDSTLIWVLGHTTKTVLERSFVRRAIIVGHKLSFANGNILSHTTRNRTKTQSIP